MRWVAVGPYGLLPYSYASAAEARRAAFAVFEQMWATQSLRDAKALADLQDALTLEDVPIPHLDDDLRAYLIDRGTPEPFLAVCDVLFRQVEPTGYGDERELALEMGLNL